MDTEEVEVMGEEAMPVEENMAVVEDMVLVVVEQRKEVAQEE